VKDDYDFEGGERGRFHAGDAVLAPPVHLDPDILTFLAAPAEARGAPRSDKV
jgi:hypothetical protein